MTFSWEKTTRGEETSYELRIASGKNTVGLTVDSTGKILPEAGDGANKLKSEEKEEKEE